MMAAWVISQAAIAAGVALTGGPESPALLLMLIPVVSLSARFPQRGVVAGVGITLLFMALATAAVDPAALVDEPPLTILAAVGVVSVGFLSTALLRSDLHHRSESVLDQLTGMLNRKALATRATELEQQSLLVSQPVGMIVADIDHFKAVNDRHGHTTGDAVLTDVAYILRKELRAFDLAYRIGGEEFLLLLPGAGVERTAQLAEDLRRVIADDTVAGGLQITMSFGVAGSSEGEPFRYEPVFAEADAALLKAKREGRNRVRAARELVPA
jgi:diguanylate cyclase (GGDEF)-like protein